MSKPLDPTPWRITSPVLSNEPWTTVFKPRPEYEQDRSKYAE